MKTNKNTISTFNAEKVKNDLIKWIQDWFTMNANESTKAVIGISGGKDSTIVAKLCVEALGADRVHGVFMPYKMKESDLELDLSREVARYLGIDTTTISIGEATESLTLQVMEGISTQAEVNITPRLRMTTLYMIAQTIDGRVSNNCNLSERVMGYSTQWGDNVGDFAPLQNLTVTEVKEIGHALGLPEEWVNKVPIDGLNETEKDDGNIHIITDEEIFGITYDEIDNVIRGNSKDQGAISKVRLAAKNTKFKRRMIANYDAGLVSHIEV